MFTKIGVHRLVSDKITGDRLDIYTTPVKPPLHPGSLASTHALVCKPGINGVDISIEETQLTSFECCFQDLFIEIICKFPEAHPMLVRRQPPCLEFFPEPVKVVFFDNSFGLIL